MSSLLQNLQLQLRSCGRHINPCAEEAVNRLTGACMIALAAAFSPGALATLAPMQADTFINSGAKTANNGTAVSLKVSPTQNALIQFDLSTLPNGTLSTDVEKATVILWVNTITTLSFPRFFA